MEEKWNLTKEEYSSEYGDDLDAFLYAEVPLYSHYVDLDNHKIDDEIISYKKDDNNHREYVHEISVKTDDDESWTIIGNCRIKQTDDEIIITWEGR